MDFALYGGAFDGAVVALRLLAAGELYLVRRARDEDAAVKDVWAYGWADRTDSAGRWVLTAVRWVGFQGMRKTEDGKTEDGRREEEKKQPWEGIMEDLIRKARPEDNDDGGWKSNH